MKGIEIIMDLIAQAMSGSLSLNELYKRWPEVFAESEFFEGIYDDIESAVEHIPGNTDGTIDITCFRESKEYYSLKYDLLILKHLNEKDIMLKGLQELKQKIVSSHLNEEEIKKMITSFN